ncbi:MAG: hypothetical protein AAF989_14560, partial [Planctomycetota bacterium]
PIQTLETMIAADCTGRSEKGSDPVRYRLFHRSRIIRNRVRTIPTAVFLISQHLSESSVVVFDSVVLVAPDRM